MYYKTSDPKFRKYGSIYDYYKNIEKDQLILKEVVVNDKIISNLYNFSQPVYIESVEGMASIIISDLGNVDFEIFVIHRNLEIKASMFFNIIPMTEETTFNLIIPSNYNLNIEFLNRPYIYNRILSKINIPEILAYYYTIKSPNYKFKGEKHNMYELTFVDNGILEISIEGYNYELHSSDLIICGKNQFHTQKVDSKSSCSYLTVMFDMECENASLICGRVYQCRKELYKAIKTFAKNISLTIPYSDNLILTNFHEIIIRIFQYDYIGEKKAKLYTGSTQYFQDELLNKILEYINKRICEPITIEEICGEFSVSRSSLQVLFKNNLNISPKKYINELKLEKSKQLIKENKYTISEIAFMLGFNSIHYFSRSFTQHYEINPSEYAQILFK